MAGQEFLHGNKRMKVRWRKAWTVWWMLDHFPTKFVDILTDRSSNMGANIIMKFDSSTFMLWRLSVFCTLLSLAVDLTFWKTQVQVGSHLSVVIHSLWRSPMHLTHENLNCKSWRIKFYLGWELVSNKEKSTEQEDQLRSHSLVSAIMCLLVLIIVLKFVGNE